MRVMTTSAVPTLDELLRDARAGAEVRRLALSLQGGSVNHVRL